eukprot:gene10621-11771_t
MNNDDNEQPCSPRRQSWKAIQQVVKLATTTAVTLASTSSILSTVNPRASHALGDLYEFQSNDHFLYAIDLQVNDLPAEVDMLEALLQESCQVIRRYKDQNGVENIVDLSFGPTSLIKSSAFKPGISTFRSYGGHAALSLHSPLVSTATTTTTTSNVVNPVGNDLQFIKIGTDSLRISKGVQKGALVKYGYGWLDLESPNGLPYQVVVGEVRDPLMAVCLRVANLKTSATFFRDTLGMIDVPYPLARQPGSQFELAGKNDWVSLGYGPDSLTLVLREGDSRTEGPLVKGSFLRGMTIIVDDKAMPRREKEKKELVEDVVIESPDGYLFTLRPLSLHQKSARRDPLPISDSLFSIPAPSSTAS